MGRMTLFTYCTIRTLDAIIRTVSTFQLSLIKVLVVSTIDTLVSIPGCSILGTGINTLATHQVEMRWVTYFTHCTIRTLYTVWGAILTCQTCGFKVFIKSTWYAFGPIPMGMCIVKWTYVNTLIFIISSK